MRLIPVLDVMSGVAVRAVAGRRAEYRPLVSRLTPSADPRTVADALRRHVDSTHLYLADLDAIRGAEPAWPLIADLVRDGFCLWVDAGVRTAVDAQRLADTGVEVVVAGLETLSNPEHLRLSVENLCPVRVAFSLDMMGGRLLGDHRGWGDTPDTVADRAVECGVRRVIVLDLAHVGTGHGTGTEALCGRLARRFEGVQIIAGGGVRGPADLRRLEAEGVAAALVASALHDGRLTEHWKTDTRDW